MRRFSVSFFLLLACTAAVFSQDISDLKAKAEAGDPTAELQLAKAYETGKGVRADRFAAADWYLKAAKAGNAEAQNTTGVLFRTGDGGRKDPEEAVKWFRLAAKQGYADSMFNLATAYYNGDGVLVSDQNALAWFIVAQAFGNKLAEDAVRRSLEDTKPIIQASGMMTASKMLINGTEIPVRGEAAVAWLNKLTEAGRKSATVLLAQLYLNGNGVPKDPERALQYCETGAREKLPQAMGCLGFIYRKGLGRPVDLPVAAGWYAKAARCGEPVSMFVLSEMYAHGEGVQTDRVQQYALLKAASTYLPEVRTKAEELKQQLSDKEVKAAEKKTIMTDHNCDFDAAMQ